MKKIKLYIVRLNRDGELKDSRPCVNCYNKIKEFGIRKIIYSTADSCIECKKVSEYYTERLSFGYSYITNNLTT